MSFLQPRNFTFRERPRDRTRASREERSGPSPTKTSGRAPDGSARETRVWIADEGAHSWLEAATPERPWYLDVLERPRVEVKRGGLLLTFDAVSLPGAQGREHIRGLLREKYGIRDYRGGGPASDGTPYTLSAISVARTGRRGD